MSETEPRDSGLRDIILDFESRRRLQWSDDDIDDLAAALGAAHEERGLDMKALRYDINTELANLTESASQFESGAAAAYHFVLSRLATPDTAPEERPYQPGTSYTARVIAARAATPTSTTEDRPWGQGIRDPKGAGKAIADAALDAAIAAIDELPAYKIPGVANPFVEYAAVLEALRGKRKGEA